MLRDTTISYSYLGTYIYKNILIINQYKYLLGNSLYDQYYSSIVKLDTYKYLGKNIMVYLIYFKGWYQLIYKLIYYYKIVLRIQIFYFE